MAAEPQPEAVAREDAEAYFAQHGIRNLFGRLIFALAQHRPVDPIPFIQGRLAKELETRAGPDEGAAVRDSPLEVKPDPQEEHDEAGSFHLDILQYLVCEKPPGRSGGHGVTAADMGRDLAAKSSWAGGFDRALLDGWVPQPSPCCAAASVAGALNGLWARPRGAAGALSVREVADLMAQRCDALRSQGQRRMERLLGISEGALEAVFQEVDGHLQASGYEWTARKGPKAVTKSVSMSAIREVLRSRQHPDPAGADADAEPGAFGGEDPFVALRGALGEAFFNAVPEGAAGGAGGDEADGAELEAEGGDDDAALVTERHPGGALVVTSTGPNFAQELQELLSKRKGVMRLRQQLPNTSEIGSWGIKQAAEELAAEPGRSPIRVSTFLGRRGGKRIVNPVSKWDTETVIAQQWGAFKAAFSDPNSAFIFHLTNHYALIFAWREWLEPAGDSTERRPMRQILTARKGQRPTVWLDFDEVRNTIVKWSGYNVLQLESLADAQASVQPDSGN